MVLPEAFNLATAKLMGLDLTPGSQPHNASPLIGIIGAGVAGLRAAEFLLEKGYRVVIFEARDRIGGRICTTSHLGKPVDLGPNWIHGTAENPIVPLSQRAGSVVHAFGEVCPVYGSDGERVEQGEADKLQEMFWETVEMATEYSKVGKSVIPRERSLFDYSVERAEMLFGADEERKRNWLELVHMWGAFIGTSVTRQSLKYFLLEEPVEGPNLFVASTYGSMLDILALPAQKSGSIKLSTPITTVTSTKSLSTGKPRILLTSTDNTFTVDRLIVTIPLGCLKRTSITFTPPLPPRLLQSISSLSYGTLEKIYVRFPTPFWHTSPTSSSFFNFLAPTYAPDTNPRKWHMCCFSLAHLPAPHNQPTLLFYVFGSASKHITSSAFSPSHTPHGQAQYAAFTQPYFSRLDGYTPECVPSRIVATAWSNDEYAGFGSYSNFQVGLHDGERDIEVLAEGLAEEGVWFAGEHTAPVLGLGSVSGAYWSGEIAAVKVVGSFEGGDEGVDGVDGVVDGVDGVDGMDGVGKPVDEAGKPVDGVCA